MVKLNVIEARLSHLGIRSGWLSRPELQELQHILMDGEEIISLANGRYFAGFATLVATDCRLLIIDKRPFFMTVEDIRYEMISEMDYVNRLLDATIHIFTINKQHRFTSMRHRQHLKDLTTYVQRRVMEIRQGSQMNPMPDQLVEAPVTQPAVPVAAVVPQTVTVQQPQQPTQKSYRDMASRLSGRVLGPVAVKAAHHHRINVGNPYAKASFVVHSSSGWLRSRVPRPDPTVVQPES